MPIKKSPIKYTSRDYESIRADLVEHARRHYPDTFKDFNEASFGSLMLDTVAYIGDILSFYLDYQVNETYFDSAVEFDNIIRLSRQLGYKFQTNPSSFGTVLLYVLVPAKSSGLGPDTAYLPVLKKGSELASISGNSFILNEDVRFDDPSNEVVAARTDDDTGLPSQYAIRAYGTIVSGIFGVESKNVGPFENFTRLPLDVNGVVEILSVVDSEGNKYFEVDHLSQNTVYKEIVNKGDNKDTVPSLLKPFIVPRRYTVEREGGVTFLQFGYGSSDEIANPSVADPRNVVLDLNGRDYIVDKSFDPYKLLKTDKFGIGPSNTTLTVKYRYNTATNVNAAAGSVRTIVNPIFEFTNRTSLVEATVSGVVGSLECFNQEPVVGDTTIDSSDEVRRRALDFFATQNRAVTQVDYESLIYSIPQSFGSIKRCKVLRDPDSLRRNLNLYVVSEAANGKLIETNTTIKENIKVWVNRYKMISDTIDILDAKVVNIGIDFEVVASEDANRFQLLSDCTDAIKNLYKISPNICEPLYITDIYSALNKVDGVIDTKKVDIVRKTGPSYSSTRFDINDALSADGRYITIPLNVVAELKYPDSDIKGTIT